MTNEGRNLAVSASKRNTLVNSAREMGYPILEVMVGNLHDIFDMIQYNVETRKMRLLT